MRILVVDDSRTARRVLARSLKSLGYDALTEAGDGVEALEILEGGEVFDLVLCDLMMPRLDGIGFIKKMRENPVHARLPVLVVSSEADPARIFEAVRAGARGYVTKPFRPAVIRRRIAEALRFAELEVRSDEVVADDSKAVLEGAIDELSILELLQFLSAQTRSGDLDLQLPALTAKVAIREGQVRAVHATLCEGGHMFGEAALERIVCEPGGRFRFGSAKMECTGLGAVDQPTLPLLFDLARRRDEFEREAGQV